MARMKFLCDAERCIECNACVTACKNEHEVPWGVNRRRVVTINDGKPGERSISVACMHCSDAPCMAVCPVDCFYQSDEGVVLHSKDLCIGCGYCFYACPFGAPQYPQAGNFGSRGKMDKCTFCSGGPEEDNSQASAMGPWSRDRARASGGWRAFATPCLASHLRVFGRRNRMFKANRILLALSLMLVGGLLGACREEEQDRVLLLKPGEYQGKMDAPLTAEQMEELRIRQRQQGAL